jgi:hypothetical protein
MEHYLSAKDYLLTWKNADSLLFLNSNNTLVLSQVNKNLRMLACISDSLWNSVKFFCILCFSYTIFAKEKGFAILKMGLTGLGCSLVAECLSTYQ